MAIYKDNTKTKSGKCWYFVVNDGYTMSNGKKKYKQYKSKKFATKREAEKEQATFLLNNSHQKGTAKPLNVLAQEWLNEYKVEIKIQTQKKIERCIRMINDYFGDTPIDKIDDEMYRGFWQSLLDYTYTRAGVQHHLQQAQLNRILDYLKLILEYSAETYYVTYKIPRKYSSFKVSRTTITNEEYYTIEELKVLLDNVENVQYRAFFTTLAYLGLREGEANGLQIRDIIGNTLAINKTVNTKIKVNGEYLVGTPKTNKSIRTLIMPNIVEKEIYGMIDYWKHFEGYTDEWYVFGGIKPLPESTMSKKLLEAINKSGLKRIRLHSLRKSFASILYNNGISPLVAQEILGHNSYQTTMKYYVKCYNGEKEKAIAMLDNLILT